MQEVLAIKILVIFIFFLFSLENYILYLIIIYIFSISNLYMLVVKLTPNNDSQWFLFTIIFMYLNSHFYQGIDSVPEFFFSFLFIKNINNKSIFLKKKFIPKNRLMNGNTMSFCCLRTTSMAQSLASNTNSNGSS